MEAPSTGIPPTGAPGSRRSARSGNPVVAIAATSLIGALIFLIPPMYFSHISADLKVSASSLGMTTTVLLLAGTIAALITGPLADRFGNRPLLITGSLAATGYFLGYSLAPDRMWLFPAAAVGGVAYAILPNLSAAAAGDMPDETVRRRALGWNSASAALSVVLVSPMLALVVSIAGWRPAFALAAALSAGVALLVRGRMRAARVPSPSRQRFTAGYGTLLRHGQTRALFASNVLRAICWFGMLTYLGVFLGDRFDAGALAIAAVFAAGGLAFFAGSLLTPKVMKLMRPVRIIALSQITMALLILMLFLGSQSAAMALVATAMLGLVGGFSFVTYATMLIEQTPAGRGTTMSINGVVTSAAATAGGALGGAVLATADYLALAIVLSVPALFSAMVVVWPLRPATMDGDPTQPAPAVS
jgi:predicted MFS family arabinose efflux permease